LAGGKVSGEQQSKPQSVFSFLFDELRGAMQDIRQKVVEEGWFGRVVTAAPVVEVDHALSRERGGLYSDDHRPSFEEAWRARAPGETPDNITKDHSIGIEH